MTHASAAPPPASQEITHWGMCDASAAVWLTRGRFAVANDEDNRLRIYRAGDPSPLWVSPDLSSALGARRRRNGVPREVDIEGAALLGGRIWWIGSHGRNRKGKDRPSRQRLFVTRLVGVTPTLEVAGHWDGLLGALLAAPALAPFQLTHAATHPPKAPGGLNIEGLAATPDGQLLIGFRNPLGPDGGALIVPLLNPDAVLTGTPARLGDPIRLPLGGRGVRSIDWVPSRRAYFIVAGPPSGGDDFDLYRWSGQPGARPAPVRALPSGLSPEALFYNPTSSTLTLLSDDGTREIEGERCKDAPESQRRFRALTFAP